MSVVKKLEKAIKIVIRDFGTVENNYDARNLWGQIQEEIFAFKKDYASKIHVSRNKLEELDFEEWVDENISPIICPLRVREAKNIIKSIKLFVKIELLGEEKTK